MRACVLVCVCVFLGALHCLYCLMQELQSKDMFLLLLFLTPPPPPLFFLFLLFVFCCCCCFHVDIFQTYVSNTPNHSPLVWVDTQIREVIATRLQWQ